MKKIFIALIILSFFSCKKDVQNSSIDAELLKKFNWQHVEKQKQDINNQEVSYNDTTWYSFSSSDFQREIQATLLSWTIGSWAQNSQVLINQKTYISKGKYELNIADSTLTFIQKNERADSLAYYLPKIGDVIKRDSLLITKVKILQLDKQTLKIASVGSFNSQPIVFNETYQAVSK